MHALAEQQSEQPVDAGGDATRGRARFLTMAIALTILGLLLREAYLFGAIVPSPGGGDSNDYWNYGWNLLHHGVFSAQAPSAIAPVPDSWRGPGYPVLLALCQWLGKENALAWALHMQVFLGTALVPATIALGRQFLSRSSSLCAGLLVAVWPHMVVFSTLVLSEIPFALAILLTLLALACADRRGSATLAALAGLLAGAAALINPVFLLFPPLAAMLLWLGGRRRLAGSYLLAFALLAGGWALRGLNLPPGAAASHRAEDNLVQGSWPQFHAAWNNRDSEPMAARYMQQIEEEATRMHADPAAGLADMLARFRSEPGTYLRWYLLEKPYLLWDWSVRIGPGDIYVAETFRSPFERVPVLRALHHAARAANPVVFLLALAAALCSLRVLLRLPRATALELAGLQVALLCCYVTAVHTVLQAEPRYSVAYRPLEFLLAVSAIAFVASAWARRAQGQSGRSRFVVPDAD